MSSKFTSVSTYTREVPKHYRKRGGIIDIVPDEHGMAEVVIERRKYIVRVQPRRTIAGDIIENLRGLFV